MNAAPFKTGQTHLVYFEYNITKSKYIKKIFKWLCCIYIDKYVG